VPIAEVRRPRCRRRALLLNRGSGTKPSRQAKQKRTEHLSLSAQALALVASMIVERTRQLSAPRQPAHLWSHLVSSGLSLEIVGRLLGHITAMTTKRYTHLADDPVAPLRQKGLDRRSPAFSRDLYSPPSRPDNGGAPRDLDLGSPHIRT
jgi:hypothetical protein